MAYPQHIKQRAMELHQDRSAREVAKTLKEVFSLSAEDIPDVRTINRWGKAPPRPQSPDRQTGNTPIVIARKMEHYDRLAEIAKALLANDLDLVKEDVTAPGERYILWPHVGEGRRMTKQELSSQLAENLGHAESTYSQRELKGWFLSHLKAELAANYASLPYDGYSKFAKEHPYEVIETLILASNRGMFKGTCRICKGWS